MPKKEKRKTGFYLTEETIDHLEKKYLLLKLEGVPVSSKSQLVEMALEMLFDDLSRKDSNVKAELTTLDF